MNPRSRDSLLFFSQSAAQTRNTAAPTAAGIAWSCSRYQLFTGDAVVRWAPFRGWCTRSSRFAGSPAHTLSSRGRTR